MTMKQHWDKIYDKYREDQVSWFKQRPEVSIELINATGVSREARIVDVGGGASTLVDWLLKDGFTRLSVLDISRRGMEHTKSRLGPCTAKVQWLKADILDHVPDHKWDVWHDRAVFHFLTDSRDRKAYETALQRSLAPGGHVIIATFGLNGPTRCSGLDVVRYSADSLSAELGPSLKLMDTKEDLHITPAGAEQQFLYCRFQRL